MFQKVKTVINLVVIIALISTFATFGAKSAIRDIARIMKVSNEDIDYLLKNCSNNMESISKEYKDGTDINIEKTTELIRIMTELPNEYADELRTILLTSENLEEITEEIMNEQPQETIKEEVTEVKEFEEEIVNIEEEKKQLEKVNKEYEESTTRMQQIYEEERDFFANNNLLTEEETKLKKEEYMTKKIAENINFIEAKNKKELLESKLGNIKKDGEEETNVEEEITEEVKINEFIPYTPEQSYLASEDISFRPIKTTRDKIEKMLEKISEYPIAIRQEQNKERNSNGQGIPEDMLKEEKTAENIEIELDEETIAEIKEEMNKKILLVNKEFKEELTSQKYLYSIVHNIEGEIVNISEQLQEYLQK